MNLKGVVTPNVAMVESKVDPLRRRITDTPDVFRLRTGRAPTLSEDGHRVKDNQRIHR
jgi:hypothetical protein